MATAFKNAFEPGFFGQSTNRDRRCLMVDGVNALLLRRGEVRRICQSHGFTVSPADSKEAMLRLLERVSEKQRLAGTGDA